MEENSESSMQDRAVQNFVDCTSWDEWKLIWNCDNQKYLCDIMRCIIQIETLQCCRRIMLHWNIHECTTCLMSNCDNNETMFVTKQTFLRSLMELNIHQRYVGWQCFPQTMCHCMTLYQLYWFVYFSIVSYIGSYSFLWLS